jgi:pyridoxine 5-phosphate synthase
VKAAHRAEADAVEFHTGRYCEARLASDRRREMNRLLDACKAAAKLGLKVAAGHGLNYQNVMPVAAIGEVEELNIGHAIVARAVLVGMERAVREMKELIARARP